MKPQRARAAFAKPLALGPNTPAAPTRLKAQVAAAPQKVRILGGQWKRTPLPVPPKNDLRPTPSRVRETLFNWLGQDLSGWRCCDVFAGSGALGLEAASRGAAQVWLTETDARLAVGLKTLCTRLQASTVGVFCGDGVAFLSTVAPLDMVFLDPPFGDGGNDALFVKALQAASRALAPDGWVYLESPRPWRDEELAPLGLFTHKCGRAGQVCFALLGRVAP